MLLEHGVFIQDDLIKIKNKFIDLLNAEKRNIRDYAWKKMSSNY